jgi:hypothetical protein
VLRRWSPANGLELLEKQPEASHDESEAHQCEAGANPCEKRAFSRQIVAESGCLRALRGRFDDGWLLWNVHRRDTQSAIHSGNGPALLVHSLFTL